MPVILVLEVLGVVGFIVVGLTPTSHHIYMNRGITKDVIQENKESRYREQTYRHHKKHKKPNRGGPLTLNFRNSTLPNGLYQQGCRPQGYEIPTYTPCRCDPESNEMGMKPQNWQE